MIESEHENAPVIVFAYNRAEKLKKCIQSLEACTGVSETILYIICDGPKGDGYEKVEEVRKYVDKYVSSSAFKNVVVEKRDKNVGLAGSVIDGVSRVLDKHGRVIVVEDDLVVDPQFLVFMNGALDYYDNKPEYGSVSAFSYPLKELKNYQEDVYATRKAECWGWGTWKDRWNNAVWNDTDFKSYLNDRKIRKRFESLEAGLDRLMVLQYQNKISSWAVRWIYYLYCNNKLTIYPKRSLVINEGFDGSGTHGIGFVKDINDRSDRTKEGSHTEYRWKELEADPIISKSYARFPRRFLPLYWIERFIFLNTK